MPARTVPGARALERVLGFEEFLRRVEGDRLERVVKTPEMFERFLPFAMAFGVERKWAKAFQGIYREPPDWYVGSATRPLRPPGASPAGCRPLEPDRERHDAPRREARVDRASAADRRVAVGEVVGEAGSRSRCGSRAGDGHTEVTISAAPPTATRSSPIATT